MTMIGSELAVIVCNLRTSFDVLPFLKKVYAVQDLDLRPLPAEMAAILGDSPDFGMLRPGAPPTWLQITALDDEAVLVLYRAIQDGNVYVAAPIRHEGESHE